MMDNQGQVHFQLLHHPFAIFEVILNPGTRKVPEEITEHRHAVWTFITIVFRNRHLQAS